jgi:hypothetical protein
MNRPLFPRLATTALLGLTLLSGPAEAKKPQPVPPPAAAPAPAPAPIPAPALTQDEVRCQSLGKMAETLAQARDQGTPYLTMQAVLRQTPTPTAFTAWLAQGGLILLPAIYEATLFTPQALRQRTELSCLQGQAEAAAARNTRY